MAEKDDGREMEGGAAAVPGAAYRASACEKNRPLIKLPLRHRLSSKVLLLTVLSVLVAEVLIFVPSVASMRMRWLTARLDTVAAVSIVLADGQTPDVPRAVQDSVLLATGTKAIALREKDASRLLAMSEMPKTIDQHIDLAHTSEAAAIWDAFDTLFAGGNRTLRVYGPVGNGDKVIELVTSDAPLREAMLDYAANVAFVSLVISLIAASLVYLAINELLLRPVRRVHRNIIHFAEAPDDPTRIIVPDSRKDELGVAQRQLAAIQTDLQRTFSEQKHLADLGLAVSKINHDMRNILASAQLMSDHLADAKDPIVQRFAPKLIRTLSRAIGYAESVIAYGRAQEAPPKQRRVLLHTIIADVEETLPIDPDSGIEFRNMVPRDFEVDVDAEQFFRIMTNLCRNAVQAMAADRPSDSSVVKRLTITGGRVGSVAIIGIEDTGPGLPQMARDNLFTAFRGSTRSGGTGLGLAIAHELVRAHGGAIELRGDRTFGTHFEIRIPDMPVSLASWRKQRQAAKAGKSA
ncbi:sensor histidine kinase [Phyllobacterium leguminum]|uniref:histidine kinase n=1 Tax=Phyllobacterium leguminum TaxID=314237 RepID=A0A318T5L1_9HYPH|nr:HAMP domain-containing sensor histidine kinase [Phyllobacterium leguminum]PYE87562.1 signal transduction histidine kinase [Phyllobacterium leguminum]